MELNMVADMEVDIVADKVADMMADMVADNKNQLTSTSTLTRKSNLVRDLVTGVG